MRFGPVPLAEAGGAILAHGLALPDGPLRKGQILDAADLARIAAAGLDHVTVARLDPGDCPEDAAARAIAQALVPDPAGQGLRIGGAAKGRVNLHATGPGIIVLDAARIGRMNAVHPMLTLATLPPWQRVQAGAMVATVKIIAYGVPGPAVAAAVAAVGAAVGAVVGAGVGAATDGAIRRAPPLLTSATLIETVLPGPPPGPKGRAAMAVRLDRLAARLTPPLRVPHQAGPLAQAIRAAPGQAVLILTASATSDPDDVAPAALRLAGGRVIRFGMPVDPGNLLMLGDLDGRPVIGLPGCARSPALNGADWVLERVICGQPVTAADIAAMGVGGLLKEMPSRPRPRDTD